MNYLDQRDWTGIPIPKTYRNNFSYDLIASRILVPENQQMIIYRTLKIDGTLYVDGLVVII